MTFIIHKGPAHPLDAVWEKLAEDYTDAHIAWQNAGKTDASAEHGNLLKTVAALVALPPRNVDDVNIKLDAITDGSVVLPGFDLRSVINEIGDMIDDGLLRGKQAAQAEASC